MTARLALIGATGTVGKEVLEILDERMVELDSVVALASRASVGDEVTFGDKTLKLKDLATFNPDQCDVAIFCAGSAVSKSEAPRFAKAGALVIDLTDAFRLDPRVPLVLPEFNAALLQERPQLGIVACPGSVTAMVAATLAPLHAKANAQRVVVSTYQGVATAGRAALDELWTQTRAIFVNDALTQEEFPKQIAFNVIPRVGDAMEDGTTTEEFAIAVELKKLFGAKLRVQVNCVRVPVFAASGAMVTAEFDTDISANDAREELREAPSILVIDKIDDDGIMTPVETVGEFATFVSRIRDDLSVENGLSWWVTADDIRKGSALIAVEILEKALTGGLVRRLS
jgi:aspartate-semialdehyde dehydrogenase